jgi:membrane dipeptidase
MTDIARDLDILDQAYAMGLRMTQVTYNWMNFIETGCNERVDAGLSHFGEKVVPRLNKLGVLIDTSHCGRQTTLDACALSAAPVMATHTAANSLRRHERGKDDEEIRAVVASGGVVGVVSVPFFLTESENVTVEAMLDHIDCLVKLVGWEHVGIGADRPEQAPKRLLHKVFELFALGIGMRSDHKVTPVNLIGLDDYRDFPNITRGLVKRGYGDEQIRYSGREFTAGVSGSLRLRAGTPRWARTFPLTAGGSTAA